MKELIGHLGALDSDASESLKAVAYFDRLLEERAGLETFVRGAAALTGCVAGISDPRTLSVRCAPTGNRLSVGGGPPADWPSKRLWHGSESAVWIEREGDCSSTDMMVLERFAAGARITLERICGELFDDRASVELLLDAAVRADARHRAAARLRISGRPRLRVVASTPPHKAPLPSLSTVIETPYGDVQATIDVAKPRTGRSVATDARVGVGPWGDLSELPRSWDGALISLRMTTPLTSVVIHEELGAIVALATLADSAGEHVDVQRLAGLADAHSWAMDTLEAVATRDTVRGAAALLGIHHSTLQARLAALEVGLGYETSTPGARVRLGVALALHRFSRGHFRQEGDGRAIAHGHGAPIPRSVDESSARAVLRRPAV